MSSMKFSDIEADGLVRYIRTPGPVPFDPKKFGVMTGLVTSDKCRMEVIWSDGRTLWPLVSIVERVPRADC